MSVCRPLVNLALAACLALPIAGCGSTSTADNGRTVDWEHYRGVSMGSQREDVRSHLGEPAYIERGEDTGRDNDCWVWHVRSGPAATTPQAEPARSAASPPPGVNRARICFDDRGQVVERTSFREP